MSSPTHAVAVPELPGKAAPHAVSPARSLRLQRQCACGGSCDSCKKKNPKELLQKKAAPGAPAPKAAAPRAASTPPTHAAAIKPAAAHKAAPSAPGPATAAPKAETKAPPAPKTPDSPKAAATKAPEAPGPAASNSKSATPEKDHPKSATPAITEKKKTGDAASDLPPIVRRVLDTPGEPLDFATRTAMEARFGHSFGDVRIHTDSLAAESARAVYAHAYTVGEHIAFDSGQYRPQTPEGQRLLAHELAHTIQQHGLQKSGGPIPADNSGDYQHLERQADAVAHSVMTRAPSAGAPQSATRAAQPRLSRTNDRTPPNASVSDSANKEDQDSLEPVDKSKYPALVKAGVAQIARLKSDPDLVAVLMEKEFEVPANKGPQALPLWEAQATAGALEAIMSPGSSEPKTKVALKQERPDTDDLRDRWLLKVGWPEGSARRLWKAAAKKANIPSADKSTFRPSTKAGTRPCDVDHILELQFGGNNVAQNMQMLDRSPNRSSGAWISHFLRKTATDVRNALQQKDPTSTKDRTKTTAIRLRFSKVKPSDEVLKDCRCCEIEKVAKDPDLLKDETKDGAHTGPRYPMRYGAFNQCVVADDESEVDLLHSSIPENKAASTLIRGLMLDMWTLPKNKSAMKTCDEHQEAEKETADEDSTAPAKKQAGKGKTAQKGPSQAGGKVSAKVDPGSRIVKRLKIKGNEKLEMLRDAEGYLAAPDKKGRIGFILDGLSEGYFTSLDVDADRNLTGTGRVTPSLSFLPNPIDVAFDKDRFVVSTQVKKPNLPIPGVEITECSIGIQIAPEFKPEGKVGFRVAPGGKQVLRGELTVSADENGLVVNGDVFATIPGVDEAKGNLTLKNKEWSGGIDIKAGDFGNKLKYVKNGEVSIRFSQQQGMSATGKVELAVPGVTDPVIASVHYDRDGWAYRAKARFNPPRIKPVDIELEYANGHLSGEGRTGFEFHTLAGEIHVIYRDEMFSGDAELGIKTDRAEGSIKVQMLHRPNGTIYFTGEGHVSFKVTNDLVASAGVKLDEQEKVTVTGELAFNKPIKLFDGFSGNYKFFDIEEDIPLPPPLSIGGAGLNVNIEGSLSAGYQVGPVELQDVKATAQFQPLEKDPALEMDLTSRLVIKATASITGTIKGGIKLSVVVASIRGDLGITATATLDGGMNVPFQAHYKEGKITADVGFNAELKLILLLALIASVEAKAGIGWLSVKTGKEWTLGSFTYDPGLSLGMSLKKPIHYESPSTFTLPSVNDIDWVKPNLNAKNLVSNTAGATPDTKEHDV